MNDLTILIQGPIHEHSISNIDTYKKYGEVIFVSWSDEILTKLHLIEEIKSKKIFLLLLNKPKYNIRKQNIDLQVFSTYYGLLLAKNNYIIKFRSDEYYTNLDPLIKKINNTDKNKIITSNIFFRKHNVYPMHISDHIICGTKSNLTQIFLNCNQYCMDRSSWKYKNEKFINNIPRHELVAEQIITLCSIPVLINNTTNNKFNYSSKEECINYIKNYFDIIDIQKLGNFIVSYTLNNCRFYQKTLTSFSNKDTDILYSIEEYV